MASNKRPLRVLLVEDCSLVAEQVDELIKSVVPRAVVTIFAGADEAIAKTRGSDFELAVLDLNLKRGSGFHVLKAAKAQQRPPTVVVMTNFGLPQYRDLAFLMGADYFLDKAVGMESLSDIVRTVAEQHSVEVRRAQPRRSSDIEKNPELFPGTSTHRVH